MSDEDEVGELLQRGAGDQPGEPPVGTLMRRGRRRRLFRRVGVASTAVAVVLAGTVAVAGLDQLRVEFSPADTGELDAPWPLRIRYEMTSYDRNGQPHPPQPREFFAASADEWLVVSPTPDGGARVQRSDGQAYASAKLPAPEIPDADEPFALLAAARDADLDPDERATEPGAKPEPLFGPPFGDSLADTDAFEVIADDLPELRDSVASRHGLDPDALVAEHVERPLASCPGEPGTEQPREDTGGREGAGGEEELSLAKLVSTDSGKPCFERHRFVALPAIGLPLWVEETQSRLGPTARLEVTHLQLQAGDTVEERLLARPEPGEVGAEWLANGRPVFVVAHEDDTVSVVDAVSTHRAYRPDKLVGWCESARIFQDLHHYSQWGPRGQYLGGPAPAGLATYAAEVDGDEVQVGARRPPASRETGPPTQPTGPSCAWPEDTTGPAPVDGHGVRHTPEEAPWPTTTAEQAAERDGPAVVEGTAVYDSDGVGRLCSDPEPGSPPRCPPDSALLAGEQLRLRDSVHTGAFLALTEDGEMALLAGFGDLTSDFFGPRPTSPNPPPGRPSPRVSLEGETLLIPAVDIDYGQPPEEAIAAGSYELGLDNRGSLPHTLVNDDLAVDLAAEPGQQATTTVDLPPGEHVFYCRIGNHRDAGMELHLTVE